MLQAIFKLIFIILLARVARGIYRSLRGAPKGAFSSKPKPKQAKESDYGELTPYEIEDADFEDLPDERK